MTHGTVHPRRLRRRLRRAARTMVQAAEVAVVATALSASVLIFSTWLAGAGLALVVLVVLSLVAASRGEGPRG